LSTDKPEIKDSGSKVVSADKSEQVLAAKGIFEQAAEQFARENPASMGKVRQMEKLSVGQRDLAKFIESGKLG
jgi:hypothetical protein